MTGDVWRARVEQQATEQARIKGERDALRNQLAEVQRIINRYRDYPISDDNAVRLFVDIEQAIKPA